MMKRIKGVNLGGWLMMEGYILGGRNIAESTLKSMFAKTNGKRQLQEFERLFRDNFITRADFRNIKAMGASGVRLPFNCRLIEKKPYRYDESGFRYIDKALDWASENGLAVILDLHAACGSQNHDWHSDSTGPALLWEKGEYRKRTYALWAALAQRYKNAPALAGYDILNEPVIDSKRTAEVSELYRGIIKAIRKVDAQSRIFIEGNVWGQHIDFLKELIDDNVTVSTHTYSPLNFTFNFIPCQRFPGKSDGELWNRKRIVKYLESYAVFAKNNGISLFVGEFGINWRGGYFGELEWLENMLQEFEKNRFEYTYWTYKAVAGSAFPDGIYQYLGNGPYVRREGPVYGFENYLGLWKKEKRDIAKFWRTESYTPNKSIIGLLKKYFEKN